MTNIDLCGIARLLRTLIEQEKPQKERPAKFWPELPHRPVRTLFFLSEIAIFSIAIPEVLWYCLCCKKGGELTWRKS